MNRAVFDCIVRYFSEDDIAALAIQDPVAVVREFHSVCEIEQFRAAIERSTKTVDATRVRLVLWGQRLAKLTGKTLDIKAVRIA